MLLQSLIPWIAAAFMSAPSDPVDLAKYQVVDGNQIIVGTLAKIKPATKSYDFAGVRPSATTNLYLYDYRKNNLIVAQCVVTIDSANISFWNEVKAKRDSLKRYLNSGYYDLQEISEQSVKVEGYRYKTSSYGNVILHDQTAAASGRISYMTHKFCVPTGSLEFAELERILDGLRVEINADSRRN